MSSRSFLLCLAALALSVPALASPIPYVINFVQDNGFGPLPSSGGFTYDPATSTFSNFLVVWHSVTFDMTALANAGPDFQGSPSVCGLPSGPSGSFELLSTAPCLSGWYAASLFGGADFTFYSNQPQVGTAYLRLLSMPDPSRANLVPSGTFSITAVPEPSGAVLLGLGFAALGVMRKFRSR
ncbi:MAG: PEP-CTERM sorting domain-containing protein [Acidobacteria bacterium]|nr:PEP-CTERM sorting domain-containing protein [Acidobacteriota bacterium]